MLLRRFLVDPNGRGSAERGKGVVAEAFARLQAQRRLFNTAEMSLKTSTDAFEVIDCSTRPGCV